MGFKDQLNKIKDNWLIIALIFVLLLVFVLGDSSIGSMNKMMSASYESDSMGSYNERAISQGIAGSYDFAPQVEERKIVKTTSLASEVERGTFKSAEDKLKNIVSSSDSYLLSSSSSISGTEKNSYYYGSYSIKVETEKYDSVISQLKEIGKVTRFNENARDITGSYTNANIELESERQRLNKYNQLYEGMTTSTSDKIALVDKIFNQERTIKYLEDSIKNMDQRVEYSTIQVTLNEERANYANVALAKFSDLVESLVGSFNGLLYFLFVVAPWALIAGIIWLIVRLTKKKA